MELMIMEQLDALNNARTSSTLFEVKCCYLSAQTIDSWIRLATAEITLTYKYYFL
jgi:hypothetical protein